MTKNILIAVLILAFVSFANSLSACGCIGKSRVRKEIKKADFIFKGMVTDKTSFIADSMEDGEYIYQMSYTFVVFFVYKEKRNYIANIRVVTGFGHGDCGYPFKLWETYIVYATEEVRFHSDGTFKTYLFTDICTRTTDKIKEEEKHLKKHRGLLYRNGGMRFKSIDLMNELFQGG